jgi:hypothetical protein
MDVTGNPILDAGFCDTVIALVRATAKILRSKSGRKALDPLSSEALSLADDQINWLRSCSYRETLLAKNCGSFDHEALPDCIGDAHDSVRSWDHCRGPAGSRTGCPTSGAEHCGAAGGQALSAWRCHWVHG